jgi:hypothetical protein
VSPRARRGLIILGLLLLPFVLGLLFTYQIIRISFPTDMAESPAIGYQEGPRLTAADGAVPPGRRGGYPGGVTRRQR